MGHVKGGGEAMSIIILLVIASAYKRPQTAAAPTQSSPCLKRISVTKKTDTTDYTQRVTSNLGDTLTHFQNISV